MANLLNLIGFGGSQNQTPTIELPDIFPFPWKEVEFIFNDVKTVYSRILTDVLERTEGIPDDHQALLWDNCVASETSDGLISLLAKGMVDKQDVCLIYRKDLKVIRKATATEETTIKEAYKKGEKVDGIYVTFKNYDRSDMLKLYSALEYCTAHGLHKSMNLSKAMQLKFNDLRASVADGDKSEILRQATAIAEALKAGKDVAMDAKDLLETAKPDVTAASKAMEFIDQKRSFYLGLPASYITGLARQGLGDSGEGDTKAVERGLKPYYFSIIKPVIETLFGVTTSFKSDDFAGLSASLEMLKTFEITEDVYLSEDNKRTLVNRRFGLAPKTKGDAPKKVSGEKPDPKTD